MSNMYGYIRVSSYDQNTDRQVASMREFGIKHRNMFIDKQSGKDFDRPGYIRMIDTIKKGDVVVVKSIDRLGRNYNDITEQWRIITKEKEADVVVLDMPLLDTRVKNDNLTQAFIADLVLQILSYVAETERGFIKQRQCEGIKEAKKKGVHCGRPEYKPPKKFIRIAHRCYTGEISCRRGAEILQMPYTTFMRKYKELSGTDLEGNFSPKWTALVEI